MPYLELDDLRGPDGAFDAQLTNDDGTPNESKDVLLQTCIDDAQAILDGELGFTLAAADEDDQVVYGDGTAYLTPPPHVLGSVSDVTAPTGYTVPDYVQLNGILITADSTGVIQSPLVYPWYDYARYNPFGASRGVWAAGVPYTVTANYGAKTAGDLLILRRATLEGAVRLYKYRDSGGSTVQGTEASVVLVKNSWSPEIREAIAGLKQRYTDSAGIW